MSNKIPSKNTAESYDWIWSTLPPDTPGMHSKTAVLHMAYMDFSEKTGKDQMAFFAPYSLRLAYQNYKVLVIYIIL